MACSMTQPPKFERWEVNDPSTPFYKRLSNPLYMKNALYVAGSVPKDADSFQINFLVDRGDESADIAFHFNPRFVGDEEDNYCAMNSQTYRSWQEEIRTSECLNCQGEFEECGLKEFPFRPKKEFSILILLTEEEYLVSVNGYHFTSFKHRIPIEAVNAIEILDDVNLSTVALKIEDHYPPCAVSDREKLEVPYTRGFIGTVLPSTTVRIRGKVPKKAESFRIDLFAGWTDCSDIMFQFSANFEEDYVTCNNFRLPSGWGEEVDADLTLLIKEEFMMEIEATDGSFIVRVGGAEVVNFVYRAILYDLKRIAISGDVKLRSVEIYQPQPKEPKCPIVMPILSPSPIWTGSPDDFVGFGKWLAEQLEAMQRQTAVDVMKQVEGIILRASCPYPMAAYVPQGTSSSTYPPMSAPGTSYQPAGTTYPPLASSPYLAPAIPGCSFAPPGPFQPASTVPDYRGWMSPPSPPQNH